MLSKRDFSPVMKRLFRWACHPNAGNRIREGASTIYSARARRPHSRIMKDEKSHLESKAIAGIDNDALEGGGVTLRHIQSS
jgi:hypothetical protein